MRKATERETGRQRLQPISRVSPKDLERAIRSEGPDRGSGSLLAAELSCIQQRRSAATRNNLTGLAISGGGIRSATFALGVMQVLARVGLLERCDYLSTVSGGGYIGSSIGWLIGPGGGNRFGLSRDNFPYGTGDPSPPGATSDSPMQRQMLTFLRQHGNYLTPGNGITLLSGVAVAIRGILLNLIVWLGLLTAAFAGLRYLPSVTSPSQATVFLGVLAVGAAWAVVMRGEMPERIGRIGLVVALFYGARYLASVMFAGGYPPQETTFRWLVAAAALLAIVFIAWSLLYSLATRNWWDRVCLALRKLGPKSWPERLCPWLRYFARWYGERVAAAGIILLAVFLVFGTLPWVSHLLMAWLDKKVAAVGPLAIVTGALSGLWSFLGSKNEGKIPLQYVATVGATLLLYGLVLSAYLLAGLLHGAVPADLLWPSVLAIGLVAAFLGYFVNLNYLTLHRYYRDRLMETFMPDVKSALTSKTGRSDRANAAKLTSVYDRHAPRGPYHLINTNVVLVDSPTRRYRMRGGDNFILSSCYCGSNATGWRDTRDYMADELTLATAMATSGAAADPNTGVGGVGLTRKRSVSALMALLNIRLGLWATNPTTCAGGAKRANHFSAAGFEAPLIPPNYTEDNQLLQLSDGGHFENLGIYELARRRLRLIVVLDGAADAGFTFNDLENAIRRIEVDFGARVDLSRPHHRVEDLIPRQEAGYPPHARVAKRGYIVGKIIYADGALGAVVYVKTTLTKDLGLKVMGYRSDHPDFPDQTTADQFFDEEQFEAYRELGYRIAEALVADPDLIDGMDLRTLFDHTQGNGGPRPNGDATPNGNAT